MRRWSYLILTTVAVASMLTLTVTTIHAIQNNESPQAALARAPKAAVAKVASSIKKLAMEVKAGAKAVPDSAKAAANAQFAAPEASAAAAASVEASGGATTNAKAFEVWNNEQLAGSYDTFVEAVQSAKALSNVRVTYQTPAATVWSKAAATSEQVHVDVPLIEQMPELERGCEVTSLAMLLQSAGVDANKMTLAQQVEKDQTPFEIKDGELYFGNPNRGFVGDIATFDNPGFGVYHEPIKQLADQYMPGRVIDATGADFADLYTFLDQGAPVWTIVNMDYEPLSDNDFEQWQTPDGPIDITYKEHSVLVTGYDDEYIYINDPLNETDKVEKSSFIAAWEQMGKQAISYVPNSESKAGKT